MGVPALSRSAEKLDRHQKSEQDRQHRAELHCYPEFKRFQISFNLGDVGLEFSFGPSELSPDLGDVGLEFSFGPSELSPDLGDVGFEFSLNLDKVSLGCHLFFEGLVEGVGMGPRYRFGDASRLQAVNIAQAVKGDRVHS